MRSSWSHTHERGSLASRGQHTCSAKGTQVKTRTESPAQRGPAGPTETSHHLSPQPASEQSLQHTRVVTRVWPRSGVPSGRWGASTPWSPSVQGGACCSGFLLCGVVDAESLWLANSRAVSCPSCEPEKALLSLSDAGGPWASYWAC